MIGDLKPHGSSDNSLAISNLVQGMSPVAVDTAGQILICGHLMDNSLQVFTRRSAHGWDLKHRLEGHSDTVSCAAVSLAGDYLVTGGWDGLIMVWDTQHWGLQASIQWGEYVNCVCWGPDGEIYAGGKEGALAKIMRTE